MRKAFNSLGTMAVERCFGGFGVRAGKSGRTGRSGHRGGRRDVDAMSTDRIQRRHSVTVRCAVRAAFGWCRPRRFGFAALGVLLTFGTTLAHAQSKMVVNGEQELAEPSTGALIQGDPETGHVVCTVTLIGCDSLVTTAVSYTHLRAHET